MHVNIPYMLDNWADLLVHLFLLKNSMPTIGRTVLVTHYLVSAILFSRTFLMYLLSIFLSNELKCK